MSETNKNLLIRNIPTDLHHKLKMAATAESIPMDAIVKRLIADYLGGETLVLGFIQIDVLGEIGDECDECGQAFNGPAYGRLRGNGTIDEVVCRACTSTE